MAPVEPLGAGVRVVHDDVHLEGATRAHLGARAVQECRADAARPEVWTDVEILQLGEGAVSIRGGAQCEERDADVVPSRIDGGDDDEDIIPGQ